jgi:toxin secretion/phage lysis holin
LEVVPPLKAVTVQDGIQWSVIGWAAASFAYLVGGVDQLFKAAAIAIALDYVTGLTQAKYNGVFSSRVMLWGLIRKVFMLSAVILAVQVDGIAGNAEALFRRFTLLGIVAIEGVSFYENLRRMDVKPPKALLHALKKMKNEYDKNDTRKLNRRRSTDKKENGK